MLSLASHGFGTVAQVADMDIVSVGRASERLAAMAKKEHAGGAQSDAPVAGTDRADKNATFAARFAQQARKK